MEIVFVTSEMTPYAQTGGLAEVCGTLPHEIAKLGHSVSVFLPKYKSVSESAFQLQVSLDPLHIPIGSEVETGRVLHHRLGQINVYLIDHPLFFHRDGLYGTPLGDYQDNDRRFSFFQRAVIEAMKKMKLKPAVIHCHDWQTGLISAYLKTLYRGDPFFKDSRTVFTIHNLAYHGAFPPDSISTTGLSWNEFRFDKLEFYGKINFLKGGIVYSDAVTTVSERYSKEIQTNAFGCGMEGALTCRKQDLFGILNGINVAEWDPSTDAHIPAQYNNDSIDKKTGCKSALQKDNGFKIKSDVPLFAFVGRLAEQKGIDLLEPLLEEVAMAGWQLVVFGTGDERYYDRFRQAAAKYPESLGLHLLTDLNMSRRIFSGADIFLMPSQFEPCGLTQMIALRYGTVPLVREVGGLADAVHEFNPDTGIGNGFSFLEYSSEALFQTMKRAAQRFADKKLWAQIVKNGMACDFSWQNSARQYIKVYEYVGKKPVGV